MKDLAKNVLADLAAMFAKAAALKMMMAFMPGGSSVMELLSKVKDMVGKLHRWKRLRIWWYCRRTKFRVLSYSSR